MSDFRRQALDRTDAPPELSPELADLGRLQAAAAALLQRDRDLYPALLERFRTKGPSSELSRLALEAAGDIAAVLQPLRARPDLLEVLEEQPNIPAPPLIVLDQLQFSYLLLTEGARDEQREALLTPDALDELLAAARVRDWLQFVGV
jgi:hypothetical protein